MAMASPICWSTHPSRPRAPPWVASPKWPGRKFLTFTYRRITNARSYTLQTSPDLTSWEDVDYHRREIVRTDGNVQTIKAKVDVGSATKLFLRLRTTRLL